MNCLHLLKHWDCGFQSHSQHGCLYCVHLFCLCCSVCIGLGTGWSPFQGVLPTVYRIKKLKSGQRPTKGCTAIIIIVYLFISIYVAPLYSCAVFYKDSMRLWHTKNEVAKVFKLALLRYFIFPDYIGCVTSPFSSHTVTGSRMFEHLTRIQEASHFNPASNQISWQASRCCPQFLHLKYMIVWGWVYK
jgi:hypothetical protein